MDKKEKPFEDYCEEAKSAANCSRCNYEFKKGDRKHISRICEAVCSGCIGVAESHYGSVIVG